MHYTNSIATTTDFFRECGLRYMDLISGRNKIAFGITQCNINHFALESAELTVEIDKEKLPR